MALKDKLASQLEIIVLSRELEPTRWNLICIFDEFYLLELEFFEAEKFKKVDYVFKNYVDRDKLNMLLTHFFVEGGKTLCGYSRLGKKNKKKTHYFHPPSFLSHWSLLHDSKLIRKR